MKGLTIGAVVVAALLVPVLAGAEQAATITVRFTGGKQLAYTIENPGVKARPGRSKTGDEVIHLDPYGTSRLPRSIRIVFEEIPATATGCGVVYKKGSRPPFKGFIMSVVDGKQVLMLTSNTGSEQPEAFSIVCYDDTGAVVAEVDPMSDNDYPPLNWP